MINLTPRHKMKIRAGLRKLWRETVRDIYVRSVRIPYKGPGKYSYGVVCAKCERHMGLSEKEHRKLKSGNMTAKPKLAYEVDHITGNHEFRQISDLPEYIESLFMGSLQILCWECHRDK